ncbi:NETI motif-containing protein [Priestia abyssalis]|uniref:NETI motif-containing protein n=1 Tax=Priestia abyssalis TaxID=1221450 RepID=UPI000994CD22|nr:NETI motif-containing protein [Priestia abyssalis]
MKKVSSKREYEVGENETIDQCLNRIKADGFIPIKRIEKPIFKEEIVNGQEIIIPAGRVIVFEVKKL